MEKIICTAYGDSLKNKGIAIIEEDKKIHYLTVSGKCNFCIEHDGVIYASVQNEKNQILEFKRSEGAYSLAGAYETEYFYSHGCMFEGKLILASFSDGLDAIYDPDIHKVVDTYIHRREGRIDRGRSHYVGVTPDGKYIYSVDNGLQQICLYEIKDGKFVLLDIREFSEENIRLMPYSSFSNCAYLNTEVTNRIYVMSYEQERFHIRSIENMESSEKCFSGGNSISEDGKRLCVSLRGDDFLHYYKIREDGTLDLLCRKKCGEMPRDIVFKNDRIYVSCTGSNKIEIYDIKNNQLEKADEIPIKQPITFACA